MGIGELKVLRYDLSGDGSLMAWSAADEYLLREFQELDTVPKQLGIYHDRFGYLACHLNTYGPFVVVANKGQEKTILKNGSVNKVGELKLQTPLDVFDSPLDLALIKIPKSLDLFRLFLDQIVKNSSDNVVVKCGFMVRHFTPKMLKIATEYFEVVEQSRAVKKARVLTLSKKKKVEKKDLINTIEHNEKTYKQYFGVFSGKKIDIATQIFLNHIELRHDDKRALDLGSGNGIIGSDLLSKNAELEVHFMDDSFLAVESSKMNADSPTASHHYNNDLTIFEDDYFDLIVTNPPFHFEYDINTKVPIKLLEDSWGKLKKGGRLLVVASQHLNYKVHLEKRFKSVEILTEEHKFVVYQCVK